MAKKVSDIIREHWQKGDYLGWFEQVYAQTDPPWALDGAHPHLVQWVAREAIDGDGQRALVVGCGLGDDAEYLAQLGYDVTAFDISETAIARCRQRFPDSPVTYVTADLFQLPDTWQGAYDLVFESRTIQALPHTMSQQACHAIADTLAPRGVLLVLCFARDPHESKDGIPWRVSRVELQAFVDYGLDEVQFEDIREGDRRDFRVMYRRTS